MKDLDAEIEKYGNVLKITKEEFIKQEAEASNKTKEEWLMVWKAIECDPDCDYAYCQGWKVYPIWL